MRAEVASFRPEPTVLAALLLCSCQGRCLALESKLPITLPLTNSLSKLPGSSFHDGPRGKGVMTHRHARMLRARSLANLKAVKASSSNSSGGAYLPLQGNPSPFKAGLYWTSVQLGQGGQSFDLQVDTGSNLVWVNCAPCVSCPTSSAILALDPPFDPAKSSTSSIVGCTTDTCARMQGAESRLGTGCNANDPSNSKCYYQLLYGDGSTTRGYLLNDDIRFKQLDGAYASSPIVFGCGFNQTGNLVQARETVDGLMGLGSGSLSLISQLQQDQVTNGVFAVCLGGEASGGGTIILGTVFSKGTAYTNLISSETTHYSAVLNGISVAGVPVPGVDTTSFSQGGTPGAVIIDTGTTLSLFPQSVVSAFSSAIQAVVKLRSVSSSGSVCFDYASYSATDLPSLFPKVTLHFDGADMNLTPYNYMLIQADDTGGTVACIGWQGVADGGSLSSIVGDIILNNFLVTFDTENSRLGWAPFDCSGGTIKASDGTYNVSIVVGTRGNDSNAAAYSWRNPGSQLPHLLCTAAVWLTLYCFSHLWFIS